MKKLGIIGTGNMAGAMIAGMMAKQYLEPNELVIFNRTPEKAQKYAMTNPGITIAASAKDVVQSATYLLLGVKPNQHEGLIEQIKEMITPNHVIILIAAGVSIADVHRWFGNEVKVARTMPNTPASVMAGMTAVSFSQNLLDDEKAWILGLLESFGLVEIIEEKLMDAVPAISGSAPAYIFQLIEAMADEGVRQGFQRQQAYRMAAQAVLGAGKMVVETGLHPAVLKDQVTSPGGTTIEALKVLEENGFRAGIMKAMAACTAKTQLLTKK